MPLDYALFNLRNNGIDVSIYKVKK
jgi:hypothetical protein